MYVECFSGLMIQCAKPKGGIKNFLYLFLNNSYCANRLRTGLQPLYQQNEKRRFVMKFNLFAKTHNNAPQITNHEGAPACTPQWLRGRSTIRFTKKTKTACCACAS
jgi:hypothetical protein